MTDISSPSINDLVQQHAYRTYEETEQYQDDLDDISTVVVRETDTEAQTLGQAVGGYASTVGRRSLQIGFERGFRARDEQVANLDNAYGELLSNSSQLRDGLSIYADFVVRLQNRMSKTDVPDGLAADISQMVYDTARDLSEI